MKPHIYVAVLLVVMLVACPPSPVTPSPDASDASPMVDGAAPADAGAPDAMQSPDAGPCSAACNRLTSLGCPEGNDTLACIVTCERVAAAQLIPLRLDCMVSAGTVDAVRACGVRCAQ